MCELSTRTLRNTGWTISFKPFDNDEYTISWACTAPVIRKLFLKSNDNYLCLTLPKFIVLIWFLPSKTTENTFHSFFVIQSFEYKNNLYAFFKVTVPNFSHISVASRFLPMFFFFSSSLSWSLIRSWQLEVKIAFQECSDKSKLEHYHHLIVLGDIFLLMTN